MSTNSPSNRYPYQHPDPKTDLGFRLLFNANTDVQQAIATLTGKIANLTTQVTSSTTVVNTTTTTPSSGTSSFPVNVTQQTADYILQQSDALGLQVFTGTGPYALELNVAVARPFLTATLNLSSGNITATPTAGSSALVNNLSSVTILPTQWAWFFFDGVNWWALDLQIFPQTFTAVTHQFLKDYTASTGLFTAAQPTYQDIVYGFDTTANRPASPTNGLMYFDTTLGLPIWYNGSGWQDAAGNPV